MSSSLISDVFRVWRDFPFICNVSTNPAELEANLSSIARIPVRQRVQSSLSLSPVELGPMSFSFPRSLSSFIHRRCPHSTLKRGNRHLLLAEEVQKTFREKDSFQAQWRKIGFSTESVQEQSIDRIPRQTTNEEQRRTERDVFIPDHLSLSSAIDPSWSTFLSKRPSEHSSLDQQRHFSLPWGTFGLRIEVCRRLIFPTERDVDSFHSSRPSLSVVSLWLRFLDPIPLWSNCKTILDWQGSKGKTKVPDGTHQSSSDQRRAWTSLLGIDLLCPPCLSIAPHTAEVEIQVQLMERTSQRRDWLMQVEVPRNEFQRSTLLERHETVHLDIRWALSDAVERCSCTDAEIGQACFSPIEQSKTKKWQVNLLVDS